MDPHSAVLLGLTSTVPILEEEDSLVSCNFTSNVYGPGSNTVKKHYCCVEIAIVVHRSTLVVPWLIITGKTAYIGV